MFKDFDQMTVHSRVWVYQSDRLMTAKEENMVAYALKTTLEQWNAHGEDLLGSVKVQDGHFVIIAVDESHKLPSGCSIDSSVAWLKKLGEEMNINFFDRSWAFLSDNEIKTIPPFELKKAVENGLIKPDTLIYNSNAVQTIAQLHSNWKIPAAKSPFLARYFRVEAA
ncbi:hypothetical protein [Jiulongibacter sediminis]|uniref:ABC transporter ATPase n=1 Tax=Jiulongibacter sediminis TaxID=1605367 RepID=A0A0N8H9S6_9BACT|nr:hypothetical protein [Jiulongibacter sediminis]KPM48196.1 hypothetical protein AFM12_05895 [Jiulongibacter sediminis]TBX24740.1 hypothetical protein TK44_05900 [Jiulongibacter sediminis]